MNGEQMAKLIMACNELGKSRILLADIVKEECGILDRLSPILQKLKECEDELCNIQYGK